jgi:hypothetical protein
MNLQSSMLRDERDPLDLTLGFFHVLPEPEAHSKGCTNQKYQDAAGVYRRKIEVYTGRFRRPGGSDKEFP